jgi:acetyltransferase EpsM
MKKLVILGGSGIGMIAASIANDLGYFEILGFLNDVVPFNSKIGKFKQYKVIGTTDDITKYLPDLNIYFFIAYVGMKNEEEIYNKILKLNIPRERFATLIHPTAIIPKGLCSIGNGVLMAPLSQISPDTSIADNCILLPNSFLGHDSTMERFAHIATNGVVGANVHIGKAVHIGSNATLREKITVGDFSLVGAGSVVLNNVAPNTIVVGNPAETLKPKQ